MMISRKNLKAGRGLTGFPLHTEERTGTLGYKLGYCEGCNEAICLRTIDTQEVLAYLFHSAKQYKNLIQKLTPKISFRLRFIKWLVGRLGEYPIEAVEN